MELIDVAHVVLLLKSNVDDGVGDLFTDTVKELGFTDDNAKFGVEINVVPLVFTVTFLGKNGVFEELDGFRGVGLLPFVEDIFFVDLS